MVLVGHRPPRISHPPRSYPGANPTKPPTWPCRKLPISNTRGSARLVTSTDTLLLRYILLPLLLPRRRRRNKSSQLLHLPLRMRSLLYSKVSKNTPMTKTPMTQFCAASKELEGMQMHCLWLKLVWLLFDFFFFFAGGACLCHTPNSRHRLLSTRFAACCGLVGAPISCVLVALP